ncbi:hypothetical protein [Dyadobacter sp. 50-39]|mgnify:FL=1|uniref:hypothetical protein n=1 Tax=Dyadobacter sp. 50-39 TaxID=1895756 RepID=UPI000A9403AF|nr:hypothetical protein [Dyadobacter sp. 50-39]
MVEVFKTDVEQQSQARLLSDLICLAFTGYRASFDLEDCDRVLRISCEQATICNAGVIGLLESFGYQAKVMEDEYSVIEHPASRSSFRATQVSKNGPMQAFSMTCWALFTRILPLAAGPICGPAFATV